MAVVRLSYSPAEADAVVTAYRLHATSARTGQPVASGVPILQAGVWTFSPDLADGEFFPSFDVTDSTGSFTDRKGFFRVVDGDVQQALVSIESVKAHLNITGTRDDLELGLYVDSVTPLIEEYVGPVLVRTVTETVHGNVLREAPVLSLLSVTYGGTVYGGTPDLNAASGVLYNVPIGATVTYTVGRETVPAAIRLAALVTVARLWETQRGSQPLPVLGGGEDQPSYVPQGGPDLPYRAQMLLAPFRRGMTVA